MRGRGQQRGAGGRKCSVLQCGSPCGPSRRLYSFPEKGDVRVVWLSWLYKVNGTKNVPKNPLLCSDHFDLKYKPRSRPDAFPTLLFPREEPDCPNEYGSARYAEFSDIVEISCSSAGPGNPSLSCREIRTSRAELEGAGNVNVCMDPQYAPGYRQCSGQFEVQIGASPGLIPELEGSKNVCMDPQFAPGYLEYSGQFEVHVGATLGPKSSSLPAASDEISSLEDADYGGSCTTPVMALETGKQGSEHSGAPGDNEELEVQGSSLLVESSSRGMLKSASKRNKCCAVNCKKDPQDTCFTFPHLRGGGSALQQNVDRLALWVKRSGNRDLLKHSPNYLNGRFYLCAKHFDSRCFVHKSKLVFDALPTIFQCQSLSDEEVSLFLRSSNYMPSAGLDFEKAMRLRWVTCSECHEKHLSSNTQSCVHGNKCPLYQAQNDMDPGPVPEELKDLTFVEEQLIARVHPVVSIFKLKGLQYGYTGNIISFSQDVSSFARKLPHKVEELPSILTVKYENEKCDAKLFNVRSEKVFRALHWLKANNIHYRDVEISDENLHALPEDGNVLDQIQGLELPGDREHEEECSEDSSVSDAEESDDDSDEEYNGLCHSGVPTVSIPSSDHQIKSSVYDWPEMDSAAIDEYNTPAYILTAFPTLFPLGIADLRSDRPNHIDAADYFQHLLHYEDERFAKHQTFRFFALNSVMRWNACTDGSIFIQNNPEFKDISVSSLKQMIEKQPNLMKKIMFQASNLRGTKPYWTTRTGELTDMVDQLGLPTIFLTLSCADLHWPDLFRLLSGKDDISGLSEKERRDLLQQNPFIVDSFFHERVKYFIESVLSKQYNVTDFWYRIEYQHRGSPHVHGVFWLAGAPDVSNLHSASDEELQEVADYFNNLVTAVNPNPNTVNQSEHPCRTLFEDVQGDEEKEKEDLAQLCVRVQRHTKCSTDYCLKGSRGSVRKCRFDFPHELREKGVINIGDDGEPQFFPARNDPMLNKFNGPLLRLWRANMDISPVLSKKNLLQYLAKYISKSEIRSKSLAEMFQHVFENFDEDHNIVKFFRRMYIKSCSDRDYSAQEVCHLLSGRNLWSAGKRKFVCVNLNPNTMWKRVAREHVSGKPPKSVLEKYVTRSLKLETTTLWEFCRDHDLTQKAHPRRIVANIVRVFPKTKINESGENNENYFRIQVLLHVAWRSENAVKNPDTTWAQTYANSNISSLSANRTNLPAIQVDHLSEENDSESEEETLNLEEFMILARSAPNRRVPGFELGLRDSDVAFNWGEETAKYLEYGTLDELSKFVKIQKQGQPAEDVATVFNVDEYSFSDDQKAVIAQLEQQISVLLGDQARAIVPKFTIVQGKAGTGKSVLIKYAKWKVAESFKGEVLVLVLGPTGVSALSIGGQTIHSALLIPADKKQFKDLSNEAAKRFCEFMAKVQFLIIDEYSMIGCTLLRHIDLRCRQGKGVNEPFGGLFVYLMGDIRQLPPVLDTALFQVPKAKAGIYAEQGKALVLCVEKVFFLEKCFRQQDGHFLQILDRISTGDVTHEDYNVLSKRFVFNVQNKSDFTEALRLFSTVEEVSKYNYTCLTNLKESSDGANAAVAKIVAKHNSKAAEQGTAKDAEGLQKVLHLGRGCRIMLTSNLWTSRGLVNGATGVVVDILYQDGEEPPAGFPKAIVCKFDHYIGPGIGQSRLVPIAPSTKYWHNKQENVSCTRIQFPLSICYACTVHKSQGLTLDKVVVNIGERDFALGISYVAFSRVKSLDGLMIVPFQYSRLAKLKKSKEMQTRLSFEKFLKSRS